MDAPPLFPTKEIQEEAHRRALKVWKEINEKEERENKEQMGRTPKLSSKILKEEVETQLKEHKEGELALILANSPSLCSLSWVSTSSLRILEEIS